MGLPEVKVSFKAPAVSGPLRAERGVLAIVVQDTTGDFDYKVYTSVSEMDTDDYTTANAGSIAMAFLAAPYKVIVVRIGTGEDMDDAAEILDELEFDWLCSNVAGLQSGLAAYVKSINTEARARKVKALVCGVTGADDEYICNVPHTTVTISGDSSTTAIASYLPRLGGVLAACPLNRSVTSYALTDLSDVSALSDIDASIDGGNLCLYKEDRVVRIARGVNTLQTVGGTSGKTADMKKIAVVEGMDRCRRDIILLFKSTYQGQKKNSGDNQALFLADVLAILASLAQEEVLDDASGMTAEIDVAAMRAAWAGAGVDVTGLTDAQVRDKTFGSKVFVAARHLRFLDAMEDLDMLIYLD